MTAKATPSPATAGSTPHARRSAGFHIISNRERRKEFDKAVKDVLRERRMTIQAQHHHRQQQPQSQSRHHTRRRRNDTSVIGCNNDYNPKKSDCRVKTQSMAGNIDREDRHDAPEKQSIRIRGTAARARRQTLSKSLNSASNTSHDPFLILSGGETGRHLPSIDDRLAAHKFDEHNHPIKTRRAVHNRRESFPPGTSKSLKEIRSPFVLENFKPLRSPPSESKTAINLGEEEHSLGSSCGKPKSKENEKAVDPTTIVQFPDTIPRMLVSLEVDINCVQQFGKGGLHGECDGANTGKDSKRSAMAKDSPVNCSGKPTSENNSVTENNIFPNDTDSVDALPCVVPHSDSKFLSGTSGQTASTSSTLSSESWSCAKSTPDSITGNDEGKRSDASVFHNEEVSQIDLNKFSSDPRQESTSSFVVDSEVAESSTARKKNSAVDEPDLELNENHRSCDASVGESIKSFRSCASLQSGQSGTYRYSSAPRRSLYPKRSSKGAVGRIRQFGASISKSFSTSRGEVAEQTNNANSDHHEDQHPNGNSLDLDGAAHQMSRKKVFKRLQRRNSNTSNNSTSSFISAVSVESISSYPSASRKSLKNATQKWKIRLSYLGVGGKTPTAAMEENGDRLDEKESFQTSKSKSLDGVIFASSDDKGYKERISDSDHRVTQSTMERTESSRSNLSNKSSQSFISISTYSDDDSRCKDYRKFTEFYEHSVHARAMSTALLKVPSERPYVISSLATVVEPEEEGCVEALGLSSEPRSPRACDENSRNIIETMSNNGYDSSLNSSDYGSDLFYRHPLHSYPLVHLCPARLFPDSPGWQCDGCLTETFDPEVLAFVSTQQNYLMCEECFSKSGISIAS